MILLTAAVVPGGLLLSGTWWPGWPDFVDLPAHIAISALLIALALAAAIVRRRFSGALFLGMVGYTMAGLFIVQGAPDLALTQVAIETLTTVLFVLVLRRLPDRFESTAITARRVVRVVIATVVAGVVFLFTLSVGSLDPTTDVSDTMIAESVPRATVATSSTSSSSTSAAWTRSVRSPCSRPPPSAPSPSPVPGGSRPARGRGRPGNGCHRRSARRAS